MPAFIQFVFYRPPENGEGLPPNNSVPSLNLGLRLENPTVHSDKSKLYEKRSLDNHHTVEWLRDVQYRATRHGQFHSLYLGLTLCIYIPFAFNFLGKSSAGSLRQGRRFVHVLIDAVFPPSQHLPSSPRVPPRKAAIGRCGFYWWHSLAIARDRPGISLLRPILGGQMYGQYQLAT